MGMELDCVRDRCCSFKKVAIVPSRAGVGFVDRAVGRECWVGYDEGNCDRGLPPCRFGWLSLALWRGLVAWALAWIRDGVAWRVV